MRDLHHTAEDQKGLLVAALKPFRTRTLLLTKLDEQIIDAGKQYEL